MFREPVKNRHPKRFLICAFPGLYRIQQLRETLHEFPARQCQDRGTRRARGARLERFAERRQPEAMRRIFSQYAQTRQRPHQPVQGRRVSCGWPSERLRALRPLRQVIGQIQFGCSIHDVRDPMRHRHLDQLRMRRGRLIRALFVLCHFC